jgi:hypothetical protein
MPQAEAIKSNANPLLHLHPVWFNPGGEHMTHKEELQFL